MDEVRQPLLMLLFSPPDVLLSRPVPQYQLQAFAQGKFPELPDEAARPLVMDDKFLLWRDAISRVAARYLCDAQGHLHMNCQGVPGEGPRRCWWGGAKGLGRGG